MAQRVTDHGDPKKYRTEIPNIVLTLGLTPYELTLYVHLKRTAGDSGTCWKTTRALAKETSMSTATVSRAKDTLQRTRPELGEQPLILVSEEPNLKGGKAGHLITIADIWPENMTWGSRFREKLAPPNQVTHTGTQVSDSNLQVTQGNNPSYTGSTKERTQDQERTLEEETPEEERQQQRAKPRADTRGARLPDDFCLNSEMREWAATNTPHVDLRLALAEFVDYWHGVPGQRGRKLDWPGTWRNRMRELEGRKNGRQVSKVDGSMAAVRQVLEEYEHGN